MKFKQIKVIIFTMILGLLLGDVGAYGAQSETLTLNALSAVLYDASSNRVLYGKNENEERAMASTTKIMTLIITLEYGNLSDTVTISKYAASQPDVQLDAQTGEQYTLNDLVYAMMLMSYNDVAVAIAEYVADRCTNGGQDFETVKNRTTEESKKQIEYFTGLMNAKAVELGCEHTNFVTVNGLDGENEKGKHRTTAVELAKIAGYAINLSGFEEVCTTKTYSFSELNGKRYSSINTTDKFLDMMDGAVGIKTGFTNEAGYCFVGALRRDGRLLITVVLGSGWPPNKSYKWADTKTLMNYGLKNYFFKNVFVPCYEYEEVIVENGKKNKTKTYIPFSLDLFLAENEEIDIVYRMPEYVNAPIEINEEVGKVLIYIDGELYTSFSVLSKEKVEERDYFWYIKNIFKNLIF